MPDIIYKSGFRPKMSIRKKFLISFLSATIIPLILLAVSNAFIFKNQAKKDALSKVRITLQGAQRIYYSQANQLKDAFLISNYNSYLVRSLISENRKFLDSLVKSYKSAFRYVSFIGIVNRSKTMLSSTTNKTNITIVLNGLISKSFTTEEPVVKTAYIKNYTLHKLGFNANSLGNMFLVTVVPVSFHGRVIGGLIRLIDLYEDSYIPRTIYNDYHMNPAIFSSIFQTQTAISTMNIPGNIFGVGSKLPYAIYKKVSSGKNYINEFNYNGKDVFVAFHPIRNIDKKVIGSLGILISNQAYANILKKTAIYSIFIIIFGLLISLIITYFASKDTLNPIYATLEAIKNFTNGDLNTKLTIKTNDEFEKIGDGFTEMAVSVYDREERMLKYSAFSDFLTKSLDFDIIISETLDKFEELINASSGIFYEVKKHEGIWHSDNSFSLPNSDQQESTDKGEYLSPKKYYGIRKFVSHELDVNEGVPGECLTKKKTIWFNDIPRNAILLKDALLEGDGQGKTLDYGFCEVFPKDIVWLPLYVEKTDIGVIMLSSIKGFKKDDIKFLEHAAKELSITLDNAKLHYKIKRLSITDELTGLYNRRYMNNILEKEFNLAKRHRLNFSYLMMDLDNFKHINDFYGHEAGDNILRSVGKIIKDSVRHTDTPVRFGGEEFVCILSHTDFNGAITIAKKIKEAITQYDFNVLNKEVTISIGIGSYPDSEINTVDDMMKIADEFLYAAKTKGKNRIIGRQDGKKIEIV